MKKITLLLFAIFTVFHATSQVSYYSFSQSNGTYTPLSGATVLATQTTANGTSNAALDDVVYNVPLPFAFTFNGVSYTSGTNLKASTNGFVTFGTTAPATNNYAPILSTGGYAGAVSPFAVDANGGYAATVTTTNGSAEITVTSGTTAEFVVGAPVVGSAGVPTGSTVVSTTATTVTISANCTSSGTARTLHVGVGQISYQTLGSSPNQKLVIQFKRMRPYNSTLGTIDYQVVLNETSNIVECIYGSAIGSPLLDTVVQVGLRGATNADFNIRTGAVWDTTTAGTTNADAVLFKSTSIPASGLTFKWTPPPTCAGTPVGGIVTPSTLGRCSGDAIGALVASGYTINVAGIVFQWEQSPDGIAWSNAVGGTGATTPTYTPPVYSGTPIQYRLKVTCTPSGLFDYSTSVTVSNPASPTTQVSNATVVNPWLTTATVNWTNGNGLRRVAVLSNTPTIVDPVNGNAAAIVANAAYSGSGQQIIYDGTGATVNVTGLTQGTSYYVKVYEYLRCGSGPYDYYYNTTTGTNTATITTLVPPSNDLCSGAASLTVGSNFAANQLAGSIAGATTTSGITASCQAQIGLDVWYTVTVPASGNLTIETQVAASDSMTDTIITAYTACGAAQITNGCDDDGGPDGPNNLMSKLTLTGRTPGEVLYIAVWKYQTAIPASTATKFIVSAYDCASFAAAPTGAASQTFCSYNNPTVADLAATGTAVKWYDAVTGGNLLASTTALVSGNVYYASQTVDCESFARLAVTATINTPTIPTGSANQTFCAASSPTLASLAVTGTGLVWYDASTAGNALPSSTVLTETTYYVASNDGTCESSRLAITTTEECPLVGCFDDPFDFGLYPSNTLSPSTCDGTFVNVLTTNSWPGEYTNVQVYASNTYTFSSSVATDYITIASEDGLTTLAVADGEPVSYTPAANGIIRFYLHTDSSCGVETEGREKQVICTTTATLAGCPTNPIPADGSTTVPAFGDIILSWDPPTTGDPVVAYNVYGGTTSGDLFLFDTVLAPETSYNAGSVDQYEFVGYWQVMAVNAAGESVGCAEWMFTTESQSTDTPDFVNLQWPPDMTIQAGSSGTVYGRVYEPGLTDTTSGQAPGIQAWVGISPEGENSNPDTWTTWIPATFNVETGNDDEYQALIGNTLIPGTYYYATRFSLNGGPYVYGGINATNPNSGGNFWDGSGFISGVLTVEPGDPVTGDCNLASSIADPSLGINVWNRPYADGSGMSGAGVGVTYHVYGPFTVDVTGSYTFTSTQDGWDGFIFIYENSFTPSDPLTNYLAGNDDSDTYASEITTNLTTGTNYYLITTAFEDTEFGDFETEISGDGVVSCVELSTPGFNDSNFRYYPNPVKNVLNLSYDQTITNVEVFNLLGQKMNAKVINTNQNQIDMSNLASGAYLIRVTAGNQVKTVKVIKE